MSSAGSLGLAAPAAVSVEVISADGRVFRLSTELGLGGIRLGRPAPFEPGRPVKVRFVVPGREADGRHELDAEVVATGDPAEEGGERGGCALYFLTPTMEATSSLSAYIADRLGLPPLPASLLPSS